MEKGNITRVNLVKSLKGFSLIELMVGLVIGLLAIYATYAIYENVESRQRTVAGVNDAQISGLYSMFVLRQEISNAGAGVINNSVSLRNCGVTVDYPTGGDGVAMPLYPLPVAIVPTANSNYDDINIFYGTGTNGLHPFPVKTLPGGGSVQLHSPLPFSTDSTAQITMLSVTGANCGAYVFTANNAGMSAPDANGNRTIRFTGHDTLPAGITTATEFFNMGQMTRKRFFVDTAGVLQMQNWIVDTDSARVGPNSWRISRTDPIISDVVVFRAQYGLDNDIPPDGVIDRWVTPDRPNNILARIFGGNPSLQSIKAIRLALIVRSSEQDRQLAGAPNITQWIFTEAASAADSGTSEAINLVVSEAGKPFGWRYRAYETVIPMVNVEWDRACAVVDTCTRF